MILGKVGKLLRDAAASFASVVSPGRRELEEFASKVRRALILSDVEPEVAKKLEKALVERAIKERPPGMPLKDFALKVLYEELVGILGEGGGFKLKPKVKVILVGLYGSGKTTTAAKLGFWLKKRGVAPKLVCLDRDRPAAYEQLKQLAEKIGLEATAEIPRKEPFIIDTAGRDSVDEVLVEEIKTLKGNVDADEVLLVIPAEMGRKAAELAEAFKEAVTGIVITRLDGSARGGGALTAAYVAGVPVKFISYGETPQDFEEFEPKRFIGRLLGIPDFAALIERVKEAAEDFSEEDLRNFTLESFYKQLKMMTRVGPLEKILMLLGLSDVPEEEVEELKEKLKKYRAIIDSMTKEERRNPEIINASRIQRIARGSGTKPEEVRELLKEYFMARKMIKRFMGGGRGPWKRLPFGKLRFGF